MSTTDVEATLDRAAEVLTSAASVALACHVNPDPDALGSSLGLAWFLRARGTDVVCSWGNDPFDVPSWVSALGGREFVVPPSEFPPAPQVMVALDTASPDRLGSLAETAERGGWGQAKGVIS